MKKVLLVPHQVDFADKMSNLSSSQHVKEALGLSDKQISLEGTVDFIRFILEEERLGKQYFRVIMNEDAELIGVITLKEIDYKNKTSHIGTWIGHPYWGQGYNEMAKADILKDAFLKLGLNYVFAGARIVNIRSQKAQIKLPYMSIGVEKEFPEEHKKLETQEGIPCVLNVVRKERFLDWLEKSCET